MLVPQAASSVSRAHRRTLLALAVGLALVWSVLSSGPATAASTTTSTGSSTCPAGAVVTVDAHPDDDLFFQNPDVLTSISAGQCVRTVYVTAGDAGEPASAWYYQSREAGLQAAYAQMAGVADEWTTSTQTFGVHQVQVSTLTARPQVSLVFFQLPDGNLAGQGFAGYGYQSLQKLWEGTLTSLTTVDGTQTYTRDDLVATIGAVITSQGATVVRTLDYVGHYGDGDHSDHHTVGYLTQLAQQRSAPSARLVGYLGYTGSAEPADVSGDLLEAKWSAYLPYAAWDWKECSTRASCSAAGRPEGEWMQRQHTVADPTTTTPTPDPTPTPTESVDVAASATVTASGENPATGQTALKVVDGVVDGYPGNYSAEWATQGGGAGTWLQLTWAAPVSIDRVVLHDRPNADDQVTAGSLVFADGSSVPVPGLADDGSATTVTFPTVTTTSLRFSVTGVSSSTHNVGLAELQAWTPTAETTPTPTPTPTPDPTESVDAAASATVTASGENPATGQTALKAVDGVVDGYPGNYSAEWATQGGGAGTWLQLTWAAPVSIDRVVLYDRPNADDQVTSGRLVFADGSTVEVGALDGTGAATTVSFAARSTTGLRFEVTTVSSTTHNVGLAELQAWTAV